MAARVSIQTEDFDLSREVAALRAQDRRVGAVCAFIGTVRDRNDGATVSSMELEHYPGMTEASIEAMIDEAQRRFDLHGVRVIHRVCCSRSTRSSWSRSRRPIAAKASGPANS
jgi:molybdopterin synthase catalytic subunit